MTQSLNHSQASLCEAHKLFNIVFSIIMTDNAALLFFHSRLTLEAYPI